MLSKLFDLLGFSGRRKAKCSINGTVFHGSTISASRDRVMVDGVDVTDQLRSKNPLDLLEVRILEGVVKHITTRGQVHALDVLGNIKAGGSVAANTVHGDVEADGSVTCDDVHGNVRADGSVSCGRVGGNVRADGSVTTA